MKPMTKRILSIIFLFAAFLIAAHYLTNYQTKRYFDQQLPDNSRVILKSQTLPFAHSIDVTDYFYDKKDILEDAEKLVSRLIDDENKILQIARLFQEHQLHGRRLTGEKYNIANFDLNYFLINEPSNYCSGRSFALTGLLRHFDFQAVPLQLNEHIVVSVQNDNSQFLLDSTSEDWGLEFTHDQGRLYTLEETQAYVTNDGDCLEKSFFEGFANKKLWVPSTAYLEKIIVKPQMILPSYSVVYYLDELVTDDEKLAEIEDLRTVVVQSKNFFRKKFTLTIFHPIEKLIIFSPSSELTIQLGQAEQTVYYGVPSQEKSGWYQYQLEVLDQWLNDELYFETDHQPLVQSLTVTKPTGSLIPDYIYLEALYSGVNFLKD
jgi:hypothetical protein